MKPKYNIGQRLWRKWECVSCAGTKRGRIEFDYPAVIKEIHIVIRKKNRKNITEVEYMLSGGLDDVVKECELLTTKQKEKFEQQQKG